MTFSLTYIYFLYISKTPFECESLSEHLPLGGPTLRHTLILDNTYLFRGYTIAFTKPGLRTRVVQSTTSQGRAGCSFKKQSRWKPYKKGHALFEEGIHYSAPANFGYAGMPAHCCQVFRFYKHSEES